MIIKKNQLILNIILSSLLSIVFFNNVNSQGYSYGIDQKECILDFNTEVLVEEETFYVDIDTLSFLEAIINFYHNNNEYISFVTHYGLDNYIPTRGGASSQDGTSTGIILNPLDLINYYKSFTILFYVENILFEKETTLWAIQYKNDTVNYINGEYSIDSFFDRSLTLEQEKHGEYERMHLDIIYNLYLVWLKEVKEKGLNYMRQNNINALTGTDYTWVSKKVLDYFPLQRPNE